MVYSFLAKVLPFCPGCLLSKSKDMLKVREQNALQGLIYRTLPALVVQKELPKKFSSKKKMTRILNDPGSATHDEVLIFAEALDVAPYLLLTKYQLGSDTVSPRERQQLRELYELKSSPLPAA